MPFFSIVIPVYKNVDYLKRLLDSIAIQSFTNYEVIITDDSPDNMIEAWLNENYGGANIIYYKNPVALGTPENWNEGIRRANGEWIKLMHDDDWFCDGKALEIIHSHILTEKSGFYFSAYNNVYLNAGNKQEPVRLPVSRWKKVLQFAPNLYAKNIVGPPSVTVVKNDKLAFYDKRMRWLVDIDYYIQIFKKVTPVYIPEVLINVGLGDLQVTTYTHNKPDVEIPEGLLMHSKIGDHAFRHVLYFDAWWRLIRNLGIKSVDQFKSYAGDMDVPAIVAKMIQRQSKLSPLRLRNGFYSKAMMFASYLSFTR